MIINSNSTKTKIKYTTFFFSYKIYQIMLLDEKSMDEILEYLEKSIINVSKDAFENLESEGGIQGVQNFLESQYDIRLENLLVAKNSSIHHLESGMKNKIIQKKQSLFDKIFKQYNN
jgi:hypothetical protein